jgi:hypothetical protein
MAAEAGPISKVLVVVGNPRSPLPLPLSYWFCYALFLASLIPRVLRLCLGLVAAMQTEAMPLVNKFKLVEAPAHESTSVPFSFFLFSSLLLVLSVRFQWNGLVRLL